MTAENAEAILQRDYAGTRILLAEENEINREVATAILEDVAFNIEAAEDGVEAVAMASRNDYQLILMDMQMPRMDGLDATREIRKLANGTKVAIIAMTANAFKEDKDRCLAAGMDDFLSKPVMPRGSLHCPVEVVEAVSRTGLSADKASPAQPQRKSPVAGTGLSL